MISLFNGHKAQEEKEIARAKQYRQKLLTQLQQEQSEMFKSNNPSLLTVPGTSLDDDLAKHLADTVDEINNGMDKKEKSVPETLSDTHDRVIKKLTMQADEYQQQAKRLNELEAEARLGIKALEAANRVLRQAEAKSEAEAKTERDEKPLPIIGGTE